MSFDVEPCVRARIGDSVTPGEAATVRLDPFVQHPNGRDAPRRTWRLERREERRCSDGTLPARPGADGLSPVCLRHDDLDGIICQVADFQCSHFYLTDRVTVQVLDDALQL